MFTQVRSRGTRRARWSRSSTPFAGSGWRDARWTKRCAVRRSPRPTGRPGTSFSVPAPPFSSAPRRRSFSPPGRPPFRASILVGGVPVAVRGVREARNRSLGMNALMTISIGGAALLGEWVEAAVVVTLFALANMLEARSLDRARRATVELFASSPERAVIRVGGPGGEERIVLAEEVRPGDALVVRPGERIPVDAVIRRGASDLNESGLTGESVPVEKKEGDALFAGTVNGRSPLIAEATRALSESTYALILRRVEEAQAQKAPVQTFMGRVPRAYTPAVLCAA